MYYEGPIYRPPSEANSLLIQATVGCPHNKCTFCMVYKDGPNFKIRKVEDVKADLLEAKTKAKKNNNEVKTIFFPAGNTIAMKTDDLCEILNFAKDEFPNLERMTVYGSSQYIAKKSDSDLKKIAKSGLTRIHVGVESGDDEILKNIKKGTNANQQVQACKKIIDAGIELSIYVILGIGGKEKTKKHALNTAKAINLISPDFIRLRTFVPKHNTPILKDVMNSSFQMLNAHKILKETGLLINAIDISSRLTSDHYTNYINLEGHLPDDKDVLLSQINEALKQDLNNFRPIFIGYE